MSDEEKTLEGPLGWPHKGPRYVYTSPFARPSEEPQPAESTAPPPETPAAAPPPRRVKLALGGAALLALVLLASATGATIAHEFWTKGVTASPPPAAVTPAGPSLGGSGSGASGSSSGSGSISIGGISIGPNGISIGNPGGSSSGSGGPANAAAIAQKVDPALVDVNVMFENQSGAGAGTGIVVSSSGEVLTNNHVIDGATRITVTDVGNGRTYDATVVGYDQSHDIAVLQLKGASGLATAALGKSSKLSVGDPVLGIGNAGGSGGTPTYAGGRVTALNQSITAGDALGGRTERLSGLIQTNADIQAGDSGGPLVDGDGRVLGMITAGSSGFGFGFGQGSSSGEAYAIPIDQVSATAAQIVAGHASATVHIGPTAFLGVQVASPPAFQGLGGFGQPQGAPSSSGAVVGGVVSGQPAEKAGLAAGDVITSLDGKRVDTAADLGKLMLDHHPGDKIEVRWTTSSVQTRTASVQLASGPPA
jgi:S1-C subfamily serine protease